MGTRGPKKGAVYAKTHTKEVAREVARELITRELEPMIQAQVANAKGLQYLVYRDPKTGKFERVKDINDVDQDKVRIEVWQKDPSVQAFTDLLNRALDKPKEQAQAIDLQVTHRLEDLVVGSKT
jgi:hypothetical protein